MLLLISTAFAQDYRFPISQSDASEMYPTAYKDHGGRDWACGSIYYSGHNGSDYGGGGFAGMEAGRTIVAAADGVVVYTHDGEFDECTTGDCAGGGGFGNYVKIQHEDGKYTYYAHMTQWSVAVSTGQAVSCGDELGLMGSSGNSTGPHLHFEVRNSAGTAEDPFDGSCSAPPSYWISQGSHGGIPGTTCPSSGPCTPVASLSCGETWSGANNGSGSTDSHYAYGCTEWGYSGSEIAFSVSTPLSETVTLSLTGMSADLDLYVLSSAACDGGGCLGASDEPDASNETVAFGATANHAYTVVVDGYEGAASNFKLSVACEGKVEEPADSEPATGDSPATVDTSPPGYWNHPDELGPPGDRAPISYGCSSVNRLGSFSLLLLALLGLRRRAAP
jgi:hypothetical protein